MGQPRIGDVGAPYLVWPGHRHPSQQVGVHLVLRLRLAGIGPRRHPSEAHDLHQPAHLFSIHHPPTASQENHHPAAAIKRMPGVLLIDQRADFQVIIERDFGSQLCENRRPAYTRQHALPAQQHHAIFDHPTLTNYGRLIPDFFSANSTQP